LAAEGTVRGGPGVDRAQQVEGADDRGRAGGEDPVIACSILSASTVAVPKVSMNPPTDSALPVA
jgi:hypothetical protein